MIEESKLKMKIFEENIPEELMALPQWVTWSGSVGGNGKLSKIPINPNTGKLAKVNDSDTWGSFDEALSFYQDQGLQGIGFVFSDYDDYVGIDIDACIDPDTGAVDSPALQTIKQFESYTEISPSGKGVHILIKGKLPAGRRRMGNFEMYDRISSFNSSVFFKVEFSYPIHLFSSCKN